MKRPTSPSIPPPPSPSAGRERLASLRRPARGVPVAPSPGWSPLLVALAIAVSIAAGISRPAAAQSTEDVAWASFDVALDVREDGSFHVVERQAVDFGYRSFRQAFAEIPLDRIDRVDNVVVREETDDGVVRYRNEPPPYSADPPDPGTYHWDVAGGMLTVAWGFERTFAERRIFLLEYDAVGALRVYPNPPSPAEPNQQIWWTAVGRQTTEIAPVRLASMTIRLPRPVDPTLSVVAQNDEIADAAMHTEDGRTWSWQARDLEAGDELTVRLQVPPLVDAAPPAWQSADDERVAREEAAADRRALVNTMLAGAGLLGLVAGGIGVYGLWYARGRDPEAGLVAEFLPEPPDDLPPGAVGTLLDEIAHQRDLVATLTDLARRGVLAIEQVAAGLGRDTRITLLGRPSPLLPFEDELVRSLLPFSSAAGTSVLLSEGSARFAAAAPEIRRRLYQELVDRGFFASSPEDIRERWRDRSLKAFLLLVIGGGLAGAVFARDLGGYWVPLVAAALLCVAVYLLSGALPRKTASGVDAAARWRAFRRYLEEIERFEKVDEATERFDRFLPYAVAFGLESSWVETFAHAGAEAPRWYAPDGGTRADAADTRPETDHRRRSRSSAERSETGDSWWQVVDAVGGSGGIRRDDDGSRDRERGGDGDGRRFDLPDWQGTSDHAGRALQSVSNGLLATLNGAGSALSAIGEAAASGDGDGGSSRSSISSSRGRSSGRSSGGRSFGGGGRSRGSSGGGRRGFG